MKYALVAVFVVLYSLGHASGKAHHSLRDLDDEEESDSGSDHVNNCFGRLISCQEPMHKYQSGRGWDTMSLLPNLMKAGPEQVCRDILSATQCKQESIDDPICQDKHSFYRDLSINIIAYWQRFCVDKYSELERNWLCLVNVTENEDLNQCWELHYNLYYDTCNLGPMVGCVADWYKANSACEEEGLELVRDFYSSYKNLSRCIPPEPESQETNADVSEDK